jgi:hypothetical protein
MEHLRLRGVAQLDRAPAFDMPVRRYGQEGCRFESCRRNTPFRAAIRRPASTWNVRSATLSALNLRDDEAQARVWMKKAAAMGDIGANMWLKDHP